MHVMEAVIDFSKLPVMSDIFVDFDFALEVIWTHNIYEWFNSCKRTKHIPSTRPGISDLPLTPPNAVPLHVRPVTSWKLQWRQAVDSS
jgi:hypothetical protein